MKHSAKLIRKPGGVSALFPNFVVLITEFGAMLKLVEILPADGAASGKTAPGSSSRPDDDSLILVPLSLALVSQPPRATSTQVQDTVTFRKPGTYRKARIRAPVAAIAHDRERLRVK